MKVWLISLTVSTYHVKKKINPMKWYIYTMKYYATVR